MTNVTLVYKNRSGYYQALLDASLIPGRAYYLKVTGTNKARLSRTADSKAFTVRWVSLAVQCLRY